MLNYKYYFFYDINKFYNFIIFKKKSSKLKILNKKLEN